MTQPRPTPGSAGPFLFQARGLRYVFPGLVALIPVLLELFHRGDMIYLDAAVVQVLVSGFCLFAAKRFPAEKTRLRIVAAALAIHALAYLAGALYLLHRLSDVHGAWLGNFSNAAWIVLVIPALMGKRLVRGKPVGTMDVMLMGLTALLLTAALGSGNDPGNGSVRVWTGIAGLAVLTLLAFTLRFADLRPGLRRFTHVMLRFLVLELLDTILINVIMQRYLPNTPEVIANVLIPLPELLLCAWVLQPDVPQRLRHFHLDRSIVDSVQPSVLTVLGVALALYAFRQHPVVAAVSVIAVVLCYAVRTQMYYALLFQERSRLLSQATEYERLATRDPLTGIGNRRWFEANLQATFSNPDAFPCTLLLVDTDHFKQVNDSYGHDTGDAVLCAIAGILQQETSHVRGACIARIGGDEFVVLLRNTDESGALVLAERLRTGVVKFSEAHGYPVTVSVGGRTVPDPVSRKELLGAADAALYRAKAAGRNAVHGLDGGVAAP